jgi:hypothetical protein
MNSSDGGPDSRASSLPDTEAVRQLSRRRERPKRPGQNPLGAANPLGAVMTEARRLRRAPRG